MSRDIKPFGLRIPPDLKDRIKESARINGRSINSEIVHRLLFSFDAEQTEARLSAIETAMEEHGLISK